jgi:hypothetical protein
MTTTLRIFFSLCAVLIVLAGQPKLAQSQRPLSQSGAKTVRYTNGQWFDGKGFRRGDWYAVNGVFTRKAPSRVDEIVGLQNNFIIPPFGDAHTHNFDGPFNLDGIISAYLKEGIFYAKMQTNPRRGTLEIANRVNRPDSVDVSYAHGGLTSSYGHGVEVYEGLALYYRTGGFNAEELQKVRASKLRENDAYYIIDMAADLEKKWPMILAGKPDFLKIYLLNTDRHEAVTSRTDTVGDRGVDPELVPQIVKQAQAAGLRVSAHVDTVFDFRVALEAGVNEMAHMPGYYIRNDDDPERYKLTKGDAQAIARRGIWVIPAPVADGAFDPKNNYYDANVTRRTDEVRKHNLQLLKAHKVKLAWGSDRYGSTPTDDVFYLQKLGVFTNAEMLKVWCEGTPQTIFPQRRLGKLAEGYEASFLALPDNPLRDFAALKNIRLRVKQGVPLTPR